MENNIIPELIDQINYLPPDMQKQVLNYVIELRKAHEHSASGKDLSRFAGSIPAEDLKIMREVIERDCERIDLDEW